MPPNLEDSSSIETAIAYKCPICAGALNQTDKCFRCDSNHSYDQAREGYLNLHVVQDKKSQNPGDSVEMMRSRQEFLNAGYYKSFAQALALSIKQNLPVDAAILDIGCGEGYYLSQLRDSNPALRIHGIDIAKAGVRMAAKRKIPATLAVASAYKLPYFDESFDAALSVFSPIGVEDCLRVLKPGAFLLMAGPGPEHLRGLVELIYDKAVAHGANFSELEECSEFELIDSSIVESKITVEQSHIIDLLRMTPYYWHTREEQKAALVEKPHLETLIQFEIRRYKKRA